MRGPLAALLLLAPESAGAVIIFWFPSVGLEPDEQPDNAADTSRIMQSCNTILMA